MSDDGFRIYAAADAVAYDEAAFVLDEFGRAFGRRRAVKEILRDDLITSKEIRERLLDRDRDGLAVSDFISLGDSSLFADGRRAGPALSRLAGIFSDRGEDLYAAIADYEDYRGEACGDHYIPRAFRGDPHFMLGAVRNFAGAYRYAAKDLRDGSIGINPDFFNQSALLANPDVVFEMPKAKRRDELSANEELLLHAIAHDHRYYKRLASDEQKHDPGFNFRAWKANPEIIRYFTWEDGNGY